MLPNKLLPPNPRLCELAAALGAAGKRGWEREFHKFWAPSRFLDWSGVQRTLHGLIVINRVQIGESVLPCAVCGA